MRKLNEESAKIVKASSQNAIAFVVSQVGQRHAKIVEAGTPLPAGEMISKPGERFGRSIR